MKVSRDFIDNGVLGSIINRENRNEKIENSSEIDIVQEKPKNANALEKTERKKEEPFSLKEEIKNLNVSLKTTLESFSFMKKEPKAKNSDQPNKEEIHEKIEENDENVLLEIENIKKELGNDKIGDEEPQKSKEKRKKEKKQEVNKNKSSKEKTHNENEKEMKKQANFINFKEEFKIL